MARHFTADNTEGYTSEQLARANATMDAWVTANTDDDGECNGDDYKRECERTLRVLEG